MLARWPASASSEAAATTIAPPSAAWPTRSGCSAIGTARIVITSATVTCAIAVIAALLSVLVSCSAGSSTAAEPEASSTA